MPELTRESVLGRMKRKANEAKSKVRPNPVATAKGVRLNRASCGWTRPRDRQLGTDKLEPVEIEPEPEPAVRAFCAAVPPIRPFPN